MTEAPKRRVIVIKHNRYARPGPCSICDADLNLCIGPCLFEEGTWKGICDECARKHAPGLLAIVRSPAAQRAYWEAEEKNAPERCRREMREILASLEAELAVLKEGLEAAERRLRHPDTQPPCTDGEENSGTVAG